MGILLNAPKAMGEMVIKIVLYVETNYYTQQRKLNENRYFIT